MYQSGRLQSTQNFSETQMFVTTRIVRQAVDDLESQLAIEPVAHVRGSAAALDVHREHTARAVGGTAG